MVATGDEDRQLLNEQFSWQFGHKLSQNLSQNRPSFHKQLKFFLPTVKQEGTYFSFVSQKLVKS